MEADHPFVAQQAGALPLQPPGWQGLERRGGDRSGSPGLDQDNGVDVFLAWVSAKYLDKEVLDNSSELSLLSSTGNTYSLQKLQDAAIIQHRMNRRMWETKRAGKEQRALVADYIEEDAEAEDGTDGEEFEDMPELDEDTQEAYVAFQNAKSKYQSMLKSRRTSATSATREERLRLAKAKSYCSACKKKGHWHKDPICPLHPSNRKDDTKGAQTAHVVYFTDSMEDDKRLHAITDSACSRTLAGMVWVQRYCDLADRYGVRYDLPG